LRAAIAALLIASAAFAQTPDAGQLYREAQEFLKAHPDSVEARANLAVALARLGRYDEAIDNYKLALARDPHNSAVRLDLALAWYKQAAFDKAANELAEVHRLQPANTQALYLLADCDLRLGRYKDAIALVEPAYQANPAEPALEYLLGFALIKDGQIEKGQPVLDRILAHGDTAEANLLLGASALAAGDGQKALANLHRAVELNPKLAGVWALYGRAQLDSNDYADAQASFRRALAADPNDFDANLDLGALLRRDTDPHAALPFLEKALQLRPASLSARFQMGAAQFSLGNLDDARRLLEGVERDSPEFQQAHVLLASIYFKLNRKEDGERERQIVLKLSRTGLKACPECLKE